MSIMLCGQGAFQSDKRISKGRKVERLVQKWSS